VAGCVDDGTWAGASSGAPTGEKANAGPFGHGGGTRRKTGRGPSKLRVNKRGPYEENTTENADPSLRFGMTAKRRRVGTGTRRKAGRGPSKLRVNKPAPLRGEFEAFDGLIAILDRATRREKRRRAAGVTVGLRRWRGLLASVSGAFLRPGFFCAGGWIWG